MAFTITELTTDSVDDPNTTDPQSTATFSPTEGAAIFCCVSTRSSDGTTFPTVPDDGNGLTWTEVDTVNHDTGGTQSEMSMYRAVVGSSPGTFALSLNSNGADRGMGWFVFEVEGVNTATNGGVVQFAIGDTGQALDNNLTLTFGDAPASDNATIVFISLQQGTQQTWSPEVGHTKLAELAPYDNEQGVVTYDLTSALQAVDTEWIGNTGYGGGIMVELELFDAVQTSGTLNGGGSITAAATQHTNQIARPASTSAAGDWDTGPTTGQNLHDYAGDASDTTYIEDTTA